MELDYFNEAANAEEFALRHAFLPFVTSPGWIPELMGPKESSRVLALKTWWLPLWTAGMVSWLERGMSKAGEKFLCKFQSGPGHFALLR